MDKNIADMIKIVKGKIEDSGKINLRNIDTIVNAANPTLMGSDQGVDGSIHAAVNSFLEDGKEYADLICRELGTGNEKNKIRCGRGQAVRTEGYGLCKNVIHVVGSQYDGNGTRGVGCSSSRIMLLESCYYDIIRVVRENAGIRNLGVPVIGAGEYGFPFKLAVKVALAGIGNALTEWKDEDEELFAMSSLEHIYFYIYDGNGETCNKNFKTAERVWNGYKPLFRNGKKVVFQNSFMAHIRYMNEIMRYDRKRGYFATAEAMRVLLMAVRFLFMPVMMLKDLFGKAGWEKRRKAVEWLALVKALLPIFFFLFWQYGFFMQDPILYEAAFPCIILYSMSDTVTYLLTLLMMADIQRPSANLIRSMIMLFVNYIEVALGLAYLYFFHYKDKGQVSIYDAARFGLLGTRAEAVGLETFADYAFLYADAAVKFFFLSLVFGYFANHMKQRKFRS